MHSLQEVLCRWNKDTFGDIFNLKRNLLHNLHRVNIQMGNNSTFFLSNLQKTNLINALVLEVLG